MHEARSPGERGWRGVVRGGWWLPVVLLVIVARKPDGVLNPQFWAEDAVVFHAEAEQVGWRSVAVPMQGYLHTLQRIVAVTTTRVVDAAWQPAAFNYAALAVAAMVLGVLGVRRWSGPPAWALGLAVALVMQPGEVMINLTNVQWVTMLLFVICAVMAPPERGAGRVVEAGALFLAGVTGPFSIVLLPLLAWRVWRFGRGAILSLVVVALAAGIQGWVLLRGAGAVAGAAQPASASWLQLVGLRVAAQTFLPESIWPQSKGALEAMGAAAVVFFAALAVWPGRLRVFRAVFFGAALLMQLAVMVRMNAERDALLVVENGPRYYFDTRILLTWVLVAAVADAGLAKWLRVGAGVVGLGALVAVAGAFRVPALPDFQWREHAAAVREGRPADIPINPVGYVYHYPGRPEQRE